MKIALDMMGGDNAPLSNINGVKLFLQNNPDSDTSILLVGNSDAIKKKIKENDIELDLNRVEFVDAPDVVEMNESKPSLAFKNKPNSSLVKAVQLVKDNEAQAIVSAGNTAALLTSSLFVLGKIDGIKRPTLATFIPNRTNGFVLADAGANIDIKPIHILQFGIMGSSYIKIVNNTDNPRIGLLNIGSEENKGNSLTLDSHALLKQNFSNFIGNIESRYILEDKADVVLCDGFTGNVALKLIEGLLSHVHSWIREDKTIQSYPESLEIIKAVFNNYNYEEHGGSPFLGVKGIVLKCHGSCSELSIANAINSAKILNKKDMISNIEKDLKEKFEIFEKIDSAVK